jgi:transposase-like protein
MTTGRSRGRLSSVSRAQLVAHALRPGAHVATLAARHGLSASHLYALCREARAAGDESSRNRLVPVVVDDTPALATESSRPGGEIEIVVAGEVRIVVRGAVELSALRTVLAVLRG